MPEEINIDGVYSPSEEVVAREIEGVIILVPLTSGVGDMEDELFTLNDTGKAIWDLLDGKRSLREITGNLAEEYSSEPDVLEEDILGFANELFERKIISPVDIQADAGS